MKRKRWTPKEEVTESVLKFREKRKWQISLRRYVLERNKSSFNAPYFGLDIESFRKWIEIQFTEDLNWDNFSTAWQFDHVVPVAYFDFRQEAELRLCWNFTNIRVEKLDLNKTGGNRVDVLGARAYFETLYKNTQYLPCLQMVEKIARIEASEMASSQHLEDFILQNKEHINILAGCTSKEYDKINKGVSLKNILAERVLMAKFG